MAQKLMAKGKFLYSVSLTHRRVPAATGCAPAHRGDAAAYIANLRERGLVLVPPPIKAPRLLARVKRTG
jgi:hypothetical protein